MSTYDSTVSGATNSVLAGMARTEAVTSATQAEQNRFLTLLTTQLRNQDPSNPMDNAQVTSQLAQMSTVDGIERLNKLVQSLIGTSEVSDATALIGHGVLVDGKNLTLTEAGAVGGFEIDTPADEVTLTIRDANGQPVNTISFENMNAGSQNFLWDGTTDSGEAAVPGVYTLEVNASFNGNKVTARPLQFGMVASVVRGANGADLQLGSLGIFKLGDIKQIL